ncbi:hypothetical protein C8Q74DRAFT_522846 [Fomes fomentarius]|nr:hypothetical protein C8Q74DRAFT_522846 [Fomes fomentarius]
MQTTIAINQGPQSVFGPTFVVAGQFPDLVLTTADQARYHVHHRRLIHASANSWGGLLVTTPHPDHDTLSVPEDSQTTHIVLHTVYGLPCLHLSPTLEVAESALSALIKYGVAISKLAMPHLPLYQLILAHAPFQPLETYALAAHFGLEPVAAAASSHLLAYHPSKLSDELSVKMGPLYFKRLLDLHETRRAALKAIVMRPPARHADTETCGPESQMRLTSAWAMTAADMAWNALPNTSTHALQSAFEKAGAELSCVACKEMLRRRIAEATQEWARVQRTI